MARINEILSILTAYYGDTTLNTYVAIEIEDLFKKGACRLNKAGDRGYFSLGDAVINTRTGAKGIVGKNSKGIIGFIFNGKWYSIKTKEIVKYE